MTDIALSQNYVTQTTNSPALEEYVHALLARQQALTLLETVQGQLQQVWGLIRRVIEGTTSAARSGQAVRVARAAQASNAQTCYNALQKRRDECIAALQSAERRANAALLKMVTPKPSAVRASKLKLDGGNRRSLKVGVSHSR